MSIFLSYRRDDTRGYTGRLHDGLAAHFGDDRVFMDVDDIEGGSNFREDVERGSAKSDVVLVVIGRRWATIADRDGLRRLGRDDDVVRFEVRTALNGPARVIPVLVDGATMPTASELPPDLASLPELNAVELTDRRWRADLKGLIAEVEQVNRQPEAGEVVAGHRIETVIRVANYGTMFRATDLATGEEVALRVMTGSLAQDAGMRDRVLGLQRALAQVDSPVVVKVRAAGIDGSRLFIATPLLNGDTLRRVLARRGRLPAEQAVEIVLTLAEALAAAHEMGLAHGDIGPSNVVLIRDREPPTVRLIDFQSVVRHEAATPAEDVVALGLLLGQLITGGDANAEAGEPWGEIVRAATDGRFVGAGEFANALRNVSFQPSAVSITALSGRFTQAFEYARLLHGRDIRKGTPIPYLAHLLAVSALVLEDNGSEDEAIAALLHDAAEDHGGEERLRDIHREFGTGVARIVRACSDTLENPKPAWRGRKEAYINHLWTAADDVLRVSLADKLHNARAILADLEVDGASIWTRFTMSDPLQQLWYYRSVADVFAARCPGPHADALGTVVMEIGQLVAAALDRS